MHGGLRRCCLLGALFLFWVGFGGEAVWAIRGPRPSLNPKTYRAPGGRFELKVGPSHREGSGEGNYVLSQDGKVKWSAKLPFTLWEAGVTNDGMVCGYAYTEGIEGIGKTGEFVVVILDSDGKIKFQERKKRTQSRFIHGPTDPIANGLLVDEAHDRLIVRVNDPDLNRQEESWWIYEISSAKALNKITPKSLMKESEKARFVLDAKFVAGTPLVLAHWWCYDDRSHDVGARYTLIDLEGKPVWRLDLPKDYLAGGNEAAQDRLRELITERGGILASDKPHGFDIFVAEKSERVGFQLEQASGKWNIKEISRAAYRFDEPETRKPLEAPEWKLVDLGIVELKSGLQQSASPIRNVRSFSFDGDGKIAFLREEGPGKPPALVLVDPTGKLVSEIALTVEVKKNSQWHGCAWVGGTEFLVANSDLGVETKARVWRVDVKSREVKPLEGFDCPPIKRLVGFADGGFAALATMRYKNSMETHVYCFDRTGKRVWELDDNYNGGDLFSAEDIARTSRDEIVIVENINHRVKCFDRKGKRQSAFDLAKQWKRTPSYPSGIAADRDGGFLVEDFDDQRSFVRMKRDGTVIGQFTPKFSDGRIVGVVDCVQAAPDGRLWGCDGHCLVRLTEKGVVDLILGAAPKGSELQRIRGVAVDGAGNIYAADERTRSVHVFDKEGIAKYVCEFGPEDAKGQVIFPDFAISDRGEVFIGMGDDLGGLGEERDFAHFSADGKQKGKITLPGKHCRLQPGGNRFVVERYQKACLCNEAGQITKQIERGADGNWLEYIDGIECGADGSIAILTDGVVNLYDAKGEATLTIALPEAVGPHARLAYDGERIVVAGECGMLLFGKSGALTASLIAPEWKDTGATSSSVYFVPYLAAGGKELLVLESNSGVLRRYGIP